jgi:hypothetical protein
MRLVFLACIFPAGQAALLCSVCHSLPFKGQASTAASVATAAIQYFRSTRAFNPVTDSFTARIRYIWLEKLNNGFSFGGWPDRYPLQQN